MIHAAERSNNPGGQVDCNPSTLICTSFLLLRTPDVWRLQKQNRVRTAPCAAAFFYAARVLSNFLQQLYCNLSPHRLTFLLHRLFRRARAANIVRRPCSDSSHVTAPYKLSFYYLLLLLLSPSRAQAPLPFRKCQSKKTRRQGRYRQL